MIRRFFEDDEQPREDLVAELLDSAANYWVVGPLNVHVWDMQADDRHAWLFDPDALLVARFVAPWALAEQQRLEDEILEAIADTDWDHGPVDRLEADDDSETAGTWFAEGFHQPSVPDESVTDGSTPTAAAGNFASGQNDATLTSSTQQDSNASELGPTILSLLHHLNHFVRLVNALEQATDTSSDAWADNFIAAFDSSRSAASHLTQLRRFPAADSMSDGLAAVLEQTAVRWREQGRRQLIARLESAK